MEFSSNYRKTNRRNKCSVKNCNSALDKNTNLSFHTVPKSGVKITRVNLFGKTEIVEKRVQWLKKLKIVYVNQDLNVCSKHFKTNDYCFPG